MFRLPLATTLLLTTLTLTPLIRAANPVFGAYSTLSCDECLDNTYLSCPGYHLDVEYGTCMCAGDGSTMAAQCLSECDPGLNEPFNVVATWYGYCVIFFKDMCPAAQEYMFEDSWASSCGPAAIAEGGLADQVLAGGDSGAVESGMGSAATGVARVTTNPTGSGASATASGGSVTATSQGSASQSSSGAGLVHVPTLAVFAGLSLQLLQMMGW